MLLFLVDLINIEIFRISFSFFYSFSFILRSRATSVWYQSITSIRDQVIPLLVLIRDHFDPSSAEPFRLRSSRNRQGVSRHSRCRRTSRFQPFLADEIYRRQPTRSVVVIQRDPSSSVDEFGFKDWYFKKIARLQGRSLHCLPSSLHTIFVSLQPR